MNTSELFGKEVLDMNAKNIGKVTDIDFDLHKGSINHILIKAGINKKFFIDVGKIDKVGDKVILTISKDEVTKS